MTTLTILAASCLLAWQWNHNPDPDSWSLLERPGHLRLYTKRVVSSVLEARNTLTQRTEGPACRGIVDMDVSGMKPGDHAGLIALQSHFGTVGVRCLDHGKAVEMCVRGNDGGEEVVERVPLSSDTVRLRIDFDFRESVDVARFYFALPGGPWQRIGCGARDALHPRPLHGVPHRDLLLRRA